MRHEWFNPAEAGYKFLAGYISCRKCGVIKNEKNADRDTCRGHVKVTLR